MVEEVFTQAVRRADFVHVHAEERYAKLLAGVTEPEEKRRHHRHGVLEGLL